MEFTSLRNVYALLAKTKTFRDVKVKVSSIYDSHPEEKCFLVETDPKSRKYKVRFTTESSKRSAATEHTAFNTLKQNNIKWVPQIYEYRPADPAYLITEFKTGKSLDKSLTWTSAASNLVSGLSSILSEIHKIEGDYFGHLGSARYKSWRGFLDVRFWKHVNEVYEAKIISSVDLRNIHMLYEESGPIFDKSRPFFLHGDVKPANIVYNSRQKSVSLIDFELARFGDIDFEWIRVYFLSKRWPAYRKLVSDSLLVGVKFKYELETLRSPTILIYSLYHLCSVLAFEHKKGLTIPKYRLEDLRVTLKAVYERFNEFLPPDQGTGRL